MIPYDYYIAYSGDKELSQYMINVVGSIRAPLKLIFENPEFSVPYDRFIVALYGVGIMDIEELLKYSMGYINSPIPLLIFWDGDIFNIEKDNYKECIDYIEGRIPEFIPVIRQRLKDYEEERRRFYE